MAKKERVKYNYQYDSVARNYAEPIEPVRIPVPSEPKPKTKVATKRQIDLAFGVEVSICGAVLFALALFYVQSYSELRTKQIELNELKSKKIELMNQMTEVESQMAKKLDLNEIRTRAVNELGMQEPLPYQIVYIDLPKESYTTYKK